MIALYELSAYLVLVLLFARGVGQKLAPQAAGAEQAFVTLSLFLGVLVALPTMLGAIGVLQKHWILGSACALAVSVIFSSRPTRIQLGLLGRQLASCWNNGRAFQTTIILCTAMVAWAIVAARTPSLGWDDYLYHLPYMAHAFQSGRLGPFPVADNVDYINSYPKSLEVIGTTFVAISGTFEWVELVQLLFLPGASVALYLLSVRLGASTKIAAMSSVVVFQLPMAICQLKTAYIDVANAALVCMVVAGLFLAAAGRTSGLIACFVTAGILTGCKPTGPYLGSTLPLLAAWLYCMRIRAHAKTFAQLYLLASFTVLLLGGHWFVRNVLNYGNPLWPFIWTLGPFQFPGRFSPEIVATWQGPPSTLTSAERWLFGWLEAKTWYGPLYNFDSVFAGFGPLWLILLLPSLITATILSTTDCLQNRKITPLLCLCLLIVVSHLLDPGRQYGRYSMYVPMLSAVPMAVLLTRLPTAAYNFASSLWIGGLAWCIFNTASFGYFTPQQVHHIATLQAFSTAPWFHGPFLSKAASLLAKDDVLLYTEDISFVGALWKSDLSNRVVGHSARTETLEQAVLRLQPTVVIGARKSLEPTLLRRRTELVLEDVENGLELRRILD